MQFTVEANDLDDAIEQLKKQKRLKDAKLNKLQLALYGDRALNGLSDEVLKDIVDNNRGCGKTTAIALQCISDAIWHPNTPIKLEDTSHGPNNQEHTKLQFRKYVQQLINQLGLQFMVIKQIPNTLTLEV